ncbi:hypothetical protein [Paenibacillus chitinolyticus]|uniref:hypothetical protein n=1 Tax=Paenibacillus chitinolyticus TaxID=79263 RepID=UPI003666E61F
MFKESQLYVGLKELLQIYQQILQNPSFDSYMENSDKLDLLLGQIEGHTILSSRDKAMLSEVYELHGQLMAVILKEKDMLNQDITRLEKTKQVTNNYGRQSNSYDFGAFFVDYKK